MSKIAVCLCIFNPVRSKRFIMNYFYTMNAIKLKGLDVYTMELVFDGRAPEIAASNNVFHVGSKSYMFHKEKMFRAIEKRLPDAYDKILFLDCDIIFDDSDWVEKLYQKLEIYDIVQPFETAHWLDLTYTSYIRTNHSVGLLNDSTNMWIDPDITHANPNYHPGFAWAVDRNWYVKYGFFDYGVFGTGDTASIIKLIGVNDQNLKRWMPRLNKAVQLEWLNYIDKTPPAKLSYCEGVEIRHLYHGALRNRQYASSNQLFAPDDGVSIVDLLHENSDEMFEWNDRDTMNPMLISFFNNRFDDGL